jgi:HEAT repeat protein
MSRRPLPLALGVLALASIAWQAARAERLVTRKGEGELGFVLTMLEAEGVGTSNRALVRAVGAGASDTARMLAMEVLGFRKVHRAKWVLLRVLDDEAESDILRQSAAFALARLGNDHGMARLRDYYEAATDQSERVYFADCLAQVGDPRGYEVVEEGLGAREEYVRRQAVSALKPFILQVRIFPRLGSRPLERLLASLNDLAEHVRADALLVVAILLSEGASLPGACDSVRARAGVEEVAEVRNDAIRLVPRICGARTSASQRQAAKEALGG